VLLVTEVEDDTSGYGLTITVDGWTDEEVSYHVEIMAEANLIRAERQPGATTRETGSCPFA
jgi:hypothetical protein